MHPIIDTHHHLWDLSIFDLPWASSSDILNRSFVMSDYFAATDGLPIAKTVYMEVDVTPEQQQAEADYVIDLCGRDDNPMAGAVVSGRVASEGFRAYITALKRSAYSSPGPNVTARITSRPWRLRIQRQTAGARLCGGAPWRSW